MCTYDLLLRLFQSNPFSLPKVRGRDTETNKIVALKKVRMEREKDGVPITCLREIKILKEINHPNIVCLYDVVVGRKLDAYVSTILCFPHLFTGLQYVPCI